MIRHHTMHRRFPILLLPVAAIMLTACHLEEKDFKAPPLVLDRLPAPSELAAISLGETEAQSRTRFGAPYWISEHHGERFEGYRIETPDKSHRKADMTVHLDYRRDASGFWRTTALHWWQSGSTARTEPIFTFGTARPQGNSPSPSPAVNSAPSVAP